MYSVKLELTDKKKGDAMTFKTMEVTAERENYPKLPDIEEIMCEIADNWSTGRAKEAGVPDNVIKTILDYDYSIKILSILDSSANSTKLYDPKIKKGLR